VRVRSECPESDGALAGLQSVSEADYLASVAGLVRKVPMSGHFAARGAMSASPPRKRTVGSARKGEVTKSVAGNADWESASAAATHCMLS